MEDCKLNATRCGSDKSADTGGVGTDSGTCPERWFDAVICFQQNIEQCSDDKKHWKFIQHLHLIHQSRMEQGASNADKDDGRKHALKRERCSAMQPRTTNSNNAHSQG